MPSFQISGRIFAVDPMATGEIREFDVDSSKKEACQLTTEKYYVRKEYCRRHPISDEPPSKKGKKEYCECELYNCDVYFYASLDDKFEVLDRNEREGVLGDKEHRYRNDLGYIKCSKGFIEMVWVNNDDDCRWIPARECGIATVFTSLCMVDPELDMLPDSGLTENFIGRHATKLISDIEKRCRRFVGLVMAADPLTGAYAYFSAAMKIGYKKMLVLDDTTTQHPQPSEWMNTEDAKKEYDSNTGKIGEFGMRDPIWWFCDEMEG